MAATLPDRLSAALSDRYSVERELGSGGMATVYAAHDLKHHRSVALKLLKPEIAAAVGIDRFLVEIRTTANLQHPHILPLFDSGEVDGAVFYVMPLVDGESLRDRIAREKLLPIDDALRIAREIGDALHYAHGHGVLHRDIKPDNILLHGGHALVADFGIALAAAKTGSERLTETGMALGTPTYMSPEQAMGERTLDARTDIYALGCVLYEMLTGDPPFTGSTAQAIVAKVLTERPASITTRRDRVPAHVEDAVLTALEKLPADRFATAAEFVQALTVNDSGSRSAARGGARAQDGSARTNRRSVIAVALATAALAATGGWLLGRRAQAGVLPPPTRLAIVEPQASIAFSGIARTIDISADGQTVVFAATHSDGIRVLSRKLDGSAPEVIPNTPSYQHLRLSRDGRFLYTGFTAGTMQRMPIGGGVATPVSGVEATSFLAFAEDSAIWWGSQLSVGTRRRSKDGRDSLVFPRSTIGQIMPGGRHALGIAVNSSANSGSPQWMDLLTGEVRTIFDEIIVEARYTMGYLIYVRPDNVMMAAPFDVQTGRVTGVHVQLAADVSVNAIGFAQFAVSDNGTVVYIPGSESDLVRVNRDGTVRVLLAQRARYHGPGIAPDGRRIAFDLVSGDERDVWIWSEASGEMTRATFQRDGHDAVWTGDGRGVFYLAGIGTRLDLFRVQPGTTIPPKAYATQAEFSFTGIPFAGDTRILAMVPGREGRGLDIVQYSPATAAIDTLLATPADESYAVPSPDGRWFAYISDHSGHPELYLRALNGSDVQLQISVDGASEPVWSPDGREIFYRRNTVRGSELIAAALTLDVADPRVLTRTALFDVSGYDAASPHANYDVSPDGRWFVFARRGGANHIVVLQNVPDLARRLSGAAAVMR